MIVDKREKSSTWAYLDAVLSPALASVGLEIQRVDSSKYRTVDLFSENGDSVLMPVFTNQSGDIGKLPGYCSNEWKKCVVMRWARSNGIAAATCWDGHIHKRNAAHKDFRHLLVAA
jgi:hypothetical protein